MAPNIFISSDPFTYLPTISTPLNSLFTPMIVSLLLFLLFMFTPLWSSYSRISLSSFLPVKFIWQQIKQTQSFHMKSSANILSTLFIFLIMTNLIGLAPYIFSLSSHLLFTLSLALPLWLSTILSALSWNPATWLAHLLPANSPNWMSPFLVSVETTSISVRPVTLSFRLGANMTAGHTVMALLSSYNIFIMFALPTSLLLMSLLLQTGYFLFETGICFIQAFIFCLLLTLYSQDHP